MYIPYENIRKYHFIAHKVRNVVSNEKRRCFNTNWAKSILTKNKTKATQESLEDVKSEHFAFGIVWLVISFQIFYNGLLTRNILGRFIKTARYSLTLCQ